MWSAGTGKGSPPLCEAYYATNVPAHDLEYGTCEFVAFGFPHVRGYFSGSVYPVVVEKADGRPDIGTAFLNHERLLVTAAHCVRNMRHVEIPGWDPTTTPLRNVFVSADERCDLAVLRFRGDPFPGMPGFRLENHEVLDDVLVMGYPPIPGFQTPLASETAQIAGYLQGMRGQIVAVGEAILDRQDYLLISARVKGGHSGGPVINRRGKVVGVVMASPAGAEGELDSLAYGAAIPTGDLATLLKAMDLRGAEAIGLRFDLTNGGFRTA